MEGHDSWKPGGKLGVKVSVLFFCEDALSMYEELIKKSIPVPVLLVSNNMWVISLKNPDGYSIEFESPADVPEETSYSDWISKK